jgi:adenine-specific DNA methylase
MPPYAPSSGISWKVPNYWVPPVHWEQNVFDAFCERFKKLLRGKENGYESGVSDHNITILNEDAARLPAIEGSSIDYIFTDPPYGDAVPYFGLSLMWSAWLGIHNTLNFDK